MKNQKFSDVLLITSRHETQSVNSVSRYSKSIPVDLLIDIFSRVPAKSVVRFRCISKLWESIFRRSDFTELFLTNSWCRPPLLLFAFKVNGEFFVFTSPQPQNPHHNLSLVATPYHKSFPKYFPSEICPPLGGLLLIKDRDRKSWVVCNPVTRESITLPKVKEKVIGRGYFGYDPINKQFKVLSVIFSYDEAPDTYWVLTLETRKRKWRRIQCDPDFAIHEYDSEICINGVLYFPSTFEGSFVILCFDIRLEKFSFVNIDDRMLLETGNPADSCWGLLNYKGKLVAHHRVYDQNVDVYVNVLWLREDAEKNKWSKPIYVQPPFGYSSFSLDNAVVGMTDTREIVFSPYGLSNPFYVFYYNVERNTLTRVNIQGFEEFKHEGRISVHTSLNYVENFSKVCSRLS